METCGLIAQASKHKETKCEQVATSFGSSCDCMQKEQKCFKPITRSFQPKL